MRTRFLSTDYFNTDETLTFLRLPLTALHSPLANLSSSSSNDFEDALLRFIDSSAIDVSIQLDSFPINSALSMFYSDVLPHIIDVGYGVSPITPLHYSTGCTQFLAKGVDLDYEESSTESQRTSNTETIENIAEERSKEIVGDKNENAIVFVQFEAPELSQYLENPCMSEKEKVQLLPEVKECDDDLDMLNLGLPDPYHHDIEDSMESIEVIPLEYDMEHKPQVSEEDFPLQNNIHPCDSMLPILEVDEIGMEDFTWLCIEDEVYPFLENIQLRHCTDNNDLELNCEGLLGSMEIDILESMSHHFMSEIPLNFHAESLNLALDTEILQIVETPYRERSPGTSDVYPSPLVGRFLFEEFEMLDSDSFEIFGEHLISHTINELEMCDQLFHRDMNFKSFDELIINHELEIIDGTFTSLHVPVLMDDENIRSLHVTIIDVLSKLEPVPLSTSDEIYLDWHLLGKDKCNGDIHAVIEQLFNDIEEYSMGSYLKSDHDNVLVLDFLLSDGPSHQQSIRENNIDMSDDCQVIENGGNLTNAGFFEKVTPDKFSANDLIIQDEGMLAESMPQFNDLDFFLNPRKISGAVRIDHRVEAQDTKSMLSDGLHKPEPAISSGSIQIQELDIQEQLDFGPITEGCTLGSESNQPSNLGFPDMIIVINTQSIDKEMIISRRSTYQKILTMEKRGVQVVERDLILPVDIIVNATMCIVWHDRENIGKKATAQDEDSSDISICIGNIAANVLTSLSFTFTTCILIFEGNRDFLGTVMELAGELYAAAAGLGINVQIFCSYSFELTEEIILNSTEHAMKFCERLFPRLPESETLAESLLTKFPSLNPLSAHAIISNVSMLSEFLEWSPEGRIRALRKYHISDESLDLLSVLCKYGEREDSKSGVTDCSSSVSSPLDSGTFVHKINSGDGKRKFIPSSSDAVHDFSCSMPSSKYMDVGFSYPRVSKASDSKVSKRPMICQKNKLADANIGPSKAWCKPNIIEAPKIPQMGDDFSLPTPFSSDEFSSQQKSGMSMRTKNRREECDGDIFQDIHEHLVDEVVDIYDKSLFGGDFQVVEKTTKSSPNICGTLKNHGPRYNKTARRLSFGSSSYEMNTKYGLEDNKQLSEDVYNDVNYNWANNSFKSHNELMGSNSMQNVSAPSSKEERGTPLSKAIHSGQLQQRGSPWTIEFLNRIKEKRRTRQQHQPCDASIPHSINHGNITKIAKRKSSSILEYYKYQGGSTPRKVIKEQKKQKQNAQPVNEKALAFLPTWTPIDKRAGRTLSFATRGTGGQTKLVWSDNISWSQDNTFSN